MKMIQKARKAKEHLVSLVFITCSLMLTGISVQAGETASASLLVNQTFCETGSSVSDEGGIFTYLLTPATAETPMPAGSTQKGYTLLLKENQSLKIGPITYSNTGVYEYQLKAEIGSEKTGYAYDKEVYFITVYVKNTKNNALITEVIAKNSEGEKVESLNFEHTYQPLASDPVNMVDPPVKKAVSGDPSSKGIFQFALTAEDKTNPMPKESTDGKKIMTIQGEGESDFGVWSYTKRGIYHYTISEENTGQEGYTYDKTVYRITDVVEDENGQLIVTRKVTDDEKKQVDTCVFQNHYSADGFGMNKGNGDESVKTGDTTNIMFFAVILIMTVICLLVVGIAKRKKGRKWI